jgi:hypothetical protein
MAPESSESANIFSEVIRLQEVTAERQGMARDLAADANRVQRNGKWPPYSILLRLATWGVLATISLGLAAISAYSSAPRPTAAGTGSAQSRTSAAEPGEADATTRRLIEGVRTLTADREELLARIVSLEHNLADVTGSIKRVADAASQHPQPQVKPTSSAAGAPAADAPASPPETPAALSVATPNVVASPAASQPASTIQAAATAASASSDRDAAASSNTVTAELGVDVGGAHNLESLRTLWTSTKRSNVALPDELYPLVLVQENSKTQGVELRLIIGPLASAEGAARLCSALLAEHRYCQPVAFEGQRLSLVKPAPKAGISVRPAAWGHLAPPL